MKGLGVFIDVLIIGCLVWSSFNIHDLKTRLEKTQSALTECTQKGENFNEE